MQVVYLLFSLQFSRTRFVCGESISRSNKPRIIGKCFVNITYVEVFALQSCVVCLRTVMFSIW